MIWKAPWGKHIDIDRIIEVSDLPTWKAYKGSVFTITYQLLDKPVMVYFNWDDHKNQMKDGETAETVTIRWYNELIEKWKENDGNKR